MCLGGRLYQVALPSGEVKSVTSFYGKGKDFADLPSATVNMFFFDISDSGKLIVAHPAMLWNHDLWTVDLPYL